METSVKAKVMVPPQPTETPEGEEEASPPAACSSPSSAYSSSEFCDPMEEFSRQLEDIVSTYSSKASVLDKQSTVEVELEKMKKEVTEDITAAADAEVSLIMKSLKKLPSSEKKLEDVVRKYAELAAQRRMDEKKLCVLQQSLSVLLDERQQLQAESRSSVTARSKLESLCRELQGHYSRLREQTLKRCREDEEKRKEMTGHFQTMLTEIQDQIEQHSSRNEKLCRENTSLTEKLESLMNQCEMREESLENINQRRDLQQKLTEAKLQQANALLTEAEERHKREKEYLLREAIDKTKKCFAMKEQELAMKKKLTLYAQKFDEFQETLAKSNEIYVRFKKEMDNMSEKMKKMDKESNLWKTRFENCNKALTDMIQERAEKSQEYELFVLKITKLEKLCRALQEERAVLYDKIKEVRLANSNIPSKVQIGSNKEETPDIESPEKTTLLTEEELEELKQIQKEDPVLTENMSRLKEEQAKLTQFAASLLATPSDDEDEAKEDVDPEEDVVSSAFIQFKTKTQVKEEAVAEQVVEEKTDKVKEVPKTEMPTPETPTTTNDTKPEAEKVQTQINIKEEQKSTSEPEEVKISPPADLKPEATEANMKPVIPVEEEKVQTESEPEEVKISPPADLKPEATEANMKPVVPVEGEKVQTESEPAPEEPTKSEPAPPSKNTSKAAAPSSAESSKKQTPKKKKKRNAKNAS